MSQIQPVGFQNMPPARPRPTNGLGLAGFIVSLVGFFLGCVLCPVGLLLSLIALFKAPRGFAIAGVILGLIGSIIPALVLFFFGFAIITAISLGKPGFATIIAQQEARQRIDTLAAAAGNALPEDAEGDLAIGGKMDGWGHPFRYRRLGATQFEIRSAGPDGILETSDDFSETFNPGRAGRARGTPRPE